MHLLDDDDDVVVVVVVAVIKNNNKQSSSMMMEERFFFSSWHSPCLPLTVVNSNNPIAFKTLWPVKITTMFLNCF